MRAPALSVGLTGALLIAVALGPHLALAQPSPEHEQLHQAALDLYSQGRRADALARAQAAYQSRPLARYLLFISRLQEELGQLEAAHDSCALYLRKYAQAQAQAEAQECAARTEAVLARLKPQITVETAPPGARVTLDGLLTEGETPWAARVEQGRHALRLQLDGHEPVEASIEVADEGQRAWRFELVPTGAPAQLQFSLRAPGLLTDLDGERLASGPFSGLREVSPGEHVVRFTCRGEIQERVLNLPPRGATQLTTPRALTRGGCEAPVEIPYGWISLGVGAATIGASVGLGLAAAGDDGEGMGLAYVVGGLGIALLSTGVWLLLD